MDNFEEDYIGGLRTRFEVPPPLDREEARSRLRRLRAAVADADPKAAAEDDEAPEEAAAFLARAEAFLSRLAGENRADSRPLLEGRAAPE